jgi:hypothetical protein
MEITSWPLGTRRVPTTRGTVTRSALRKFSSRSSAPQLEQLGTVVILRGAFFASRRISSSDAPRPLLG